VVVLIHEDKKLLELYKKYQTTTLQA